MAKNKKNNISKSIKNEQQLEEVIEASKDIDFTKDQNVAKKKVAITETEEIKERRIRDAENFKKNKAKKAAVKAARKEKLREINNNTVIRVNGKPAKRG